MKTWRQNERQRLLAARAALSAEQHHQIAQACLNYISAYLSECEPGILGMYWPIKKELDCRPLAAALIKSGWVLTVPVINEETRKLEFARWQPDMPMVTGIWNIPVPEEPEWLTPSRFLVPLVGFDKANYRLGYGGGYYDRTLADMAEPVETIGVGMELGRFETIHPQEWDIPMHHIITEAGIQIAEPQSSFDL